MKQQAIDKVRETLDKAAQLYGRAFPMPAIHFDLKGRTAGQAFYRENKIRFNETLLRENGQDFIDRTPAHEAAHLIARAVYGSFIKPHGHEWKGVMRRLGLKPTRCHSYDVSNAARSTRDTFTYTCGCQEFQITAIRARRIQAGKNYSCRKCKGKLRPASQGAIAIGKRLPFIFG